MKKIFLALLFCTTFLVTGCSSDSSSTTTSEVEYSDDEFETLASQATQLEFNLAYGNSERTMTYGHTTPLTLPDGTTYTNGNLKPTWKAISSEMGVSFIDNTIQTQTSENMIQVQSVTSFNSSNIYGGSGIAEDLMNYGVQGDFVDLNSYMDYMPNFSSYLEENPDIESAITAYDGGIYYVPYVAEVGEVARSYTMRTDWVELLLDGSPKYDTTKMDNFGTYEAFYNNTDNVRTTAVSPKDGVTITKTGTENIIDLQNALVESSGGYVTGAQLGAQMIEYINTNYAGQYTNPSQLFVGDSAAYDIDELIALMRVIKANPLLLSSSSSTTGKTASEVWPFFVRLSEYREDILRFSTYFNGVSLYGSDSYTSRWEIDENGELQYTYSQEDTYEVLTYLSAMWDEGLIYTDSLTTTNTQDFRLKLYGEDDAYIPQFGFMTSDFIASTTADSLTTNVEAVLPPVANVNGVWQYYIDNSRSIKPDGWAISTAGSTDAEIAKAIQLFDFMFSEEGSQLQNYGVDALLQDGEIWSRDGFTTEDDYPLYVDWVQTQADYYTEGDLSTFLRDYIGSQMPVGYAKEIGFEYQYTSDRGFEAIEMYANSNVNFPSYEGTGLDGDNDYYYTLVPPTFSMTEMQQTTVKANSPQDATIEIMFNVIRYYNTSTTVSLMAYTYEDYYSIWQAVGIETYVEVYQQAYNNMKALNLA